MSSPIHRLLNLSIAVACLFQVGASPNVDRPVRKPSSVGHRRPSSDLAGVLVAKSAIPAQARALGYSRIPPEKDAMNLLPVSEPWEDSLGPGDEEFIAASSAPSRVRNQPAVSPPSALTLPCSTPRSLMLHSNFGAERMEALAEEIVRQGLKTITYEQVADRLAHGMCPPPDAMIVSLDDLGVAWLHPVFKDMIEAFTRRGLTLVLAVVVRPPYDPPVWEYLRELQRGGVEIASHTVDHADLAVLAPEALAFQLHQSFVALCTNLDRCPRTIVLPYGAIDGHGRVMQAARDYTFVVGIAGGKTYEGEGPYYLGRIGPYVEDPGVTLRRLELSFGG